MKYQHLLLLSILASVPVTNYAALGPIVVTASLTEQERELAAIPVTVIDQQAIAQSGANNLAELLRGQAGVHVSDLFGDGSQTTIDLRGFGPTAVSNTLILVDGRNLNNSTDTAAPDLSTISLEDIEQIEILQGSAGVLYGNQAVGGVINIILKKITENSAQVAVTAGSYDSSKLSASVKRVFGNSQLSLTAADHASDNYRDHNRADKQYFSLRGAHQFDNLSAYVELSSTDDYLQTPGALLQAEMDADRTQSHSDYANDYFDTQTDVARIGIDKTLDDSRSINIDFSQRITDRDFIQSFRSYPGTISTQDRDTKTLSGKYIFKPDSSPGSSVILGANLEKTDYKLVTSIGPQEMLQSINDIYLSTNWSLSAQSMLTAGLRYSDQQADIDADNFDKSVTALSLGITRRLGDWKLSARADQNFRFATVEEHTSAPDPSKGLKVQQGISYELSAELFENSNRYRATLYALELDDEITYDATIGKNINLDATSRIGLIIESFHQWSKQFSTSVNLTLLDAEITNGPYQGRQLPLVPEKTLRLDGRYQFNTTTRASLELVAVDEQVFGGDFNNELGKLDAYQVLNSNISFRAQQWELSFRINNLLDAEYSESGNMYSDYSAFPAPPVNYESFFPSPERNFWITARVEF